MCKRFLAIILCLLMITALVACNGGDEPAATTAATTEATTGVTTTTEITEAERLTLEEYLATVTYRNFELTGNTSPYFMGRWFEKEISGVSHMVTVTSGSHCYFMTDGATSIDVEFTLLTREKSTHFAYSIDGGTPVRQRVTNKTVTLPDAEYHTVRIIADGIEEGGGKKWTEEQGYALKSITASEGGSIYGIKPKNKIVFYYGDSITEGIYALGSDAEYNSAVNSFTWHSAEKLGVTPYFIGYGASGFTVSGSFAPMIDAIDYNSKDRPLTDTTVPDVIVISHGTNESSTSRDAFETAAKAAIERLNEKYPNTPIIFLGHGNSVNQKYVLCPGIADDYENVYWVGSKPWGITFTDSCHPNAAGAKKLGNKLADEMISILGEDFFK